MKRSWGGGGGTDPGKGSGSRETGVVEGGKTLGGMLLLYERRISFK